MKLENEYEYEAFVSALLAQLRVEHAKEHFLAAIYLTRLHLANTNEDRQRILRDLVETVFLMLPIGELILMTPEEGIQLQAACTVSFEAAPLLAHYLAELSMNPNPIAQKRVFEELKLASKVLDPLRTALFEVSALGDYEEHWDWLNDLTSGHLAQVQEENESNKGEEKK